MRPKNQALKERVRVAADEFYLENRRSPNLRELSEVVGSTKSTVRRYLMEYTESGELSYDGVTIRTPLMESIDLNTVSVPVVGTVVCGTPTGAEEVVESYISMPESLLRSGDFFALRANGNSMIDAGISPGDLVLARRGETAQNGDIVVAVVDNENTLKRYFSDPDGKIRLHPENKSLSDIVVDSCDIEGVAEYIVHRVK